MIGCFTSEPSFLGCDAAQKEPSRSASLARPWPSHCCAARWHSSLDGLRDTSLYSFTERRERERENNITIPLCPSAVPQQNNLQADSNSRWFLTFLTTSVTENPVQLQLNPWQPSLDLWYMSHRHHLKNNLKNWVSAMSFVRKLSPSPFWQGLPMCCCMHTGVLSKCYSSILTWFSVSHLTAIFKHRESLLTVHHDNS